MDNWISNVEVRSQQRGRGQVIKRTQAGGGDNQPLISAFACGGVSANPVTATHCNHIYFRCEHVHGQRHLHVSHFVKMTGLVAPRMFDNNANCTKSSFGWIPTNGAQKREFLDARNRRRVPTMSTPHIFTACVRAATHFTAAFVKWDVSAVSCPVNTSKMWYKRVLRKKSCSFPLLSPQVLHGEKMGGGGGCLSEHDAGRKKTKGISYDVSKNVSKIFAKAVTINS